MRLKFLALATITLSLSTPDAAASVIETHHESALTRAREAFAPIIKEVAGAYSYYADSHALRIDEPHSNETLDGVLREAVETLRRSLGEYHWPDEVDLIEVSDPEIQSRSHTLLTSATQAIKGANRETTLNQAKEDLTHALSSPELRSFIGHDTNPYGYCGFAALVIGREVLILESCHVE
jgi:hypothetical protein